MHRRRGSVAVAAASLVAALVAGCASGGPSATAARTPAARMIGPGQLFIRAQEREPLPALTGRTLTGKTLSLADPAGRVVVLNVWASWCVECRPESAGLAALDRSLAARGVRFVGIDEQDRAARARRFAATVGARYPSLVDTNGRLLARLTLLPGNGIPSTLIVDRQGRMAARIVGTARRAALARLIGRVAAGQ